MALPNKYEVKKMQRAANFSEKFCIFAVHCIFVVFKTLNVYDRT